MSRGKYAKKAALRREDAEVQAELEAAQRSLVTLSARADELQSALDAERSARKEERRRLEAMLEERVSPEVSALRQALEEQRRRAQQSEADFERLREQFRSINDNIIAFLEDGFGLSVVEAMEVLMSLTGARLDSDDPRILVSEALGVRRNTRMTREDVVALQAAHGARNRTDVVKILHRKIADAMAREVPDNADSAPQPVG